MVYSADDTCRVVGEVIEVDADKVSELDEYEHALSRQEVEVYLEDNSVVKAAAYVAAGNISPEARVIEGGDWVKYCRRPLGPMRVFG